MLTKTKRIVWLVCLAAAGVGPLAGSARGAGTRYYVQLVWGTDQPKPAVGPFRAVDPKLNQLLSGHFRWKNYWEVSSRSVTLEQGKAESVELSPDCRIEVQLIPPQSREVRVFRNGKLVRTSRADARSSGISIHGGDTRADGAWFVVLRQDKPEYP